MNFEPRIMSRSYSYSEMRQDLSEFEIIGIEASMSEEYNVNQWGLVYTSTSGCAQISPTGYCTIQAEKYNDDGEYEHTKQVNVDFFTLTESGILIAVGYDVEDEDEQDQIIVRMC